MITSLYLGLLGLLYIFMTFETIKARWDNKISLGAGPQNEIAHFTSAHNNFSNYAPLFLLGLFVLEAQSIHPLFLHIASLIFVMGRIFHYLAMRGKKMNFRRRKIGMILTIASLISLFSCNLLCFFLK